MKARFLCENCRKEVAHDVEVCPHCGTNFIAVKCPMCQFEGKISQFSDGCPQCHYHGEKLNRLLTSYERDAYLPDRSVNAARKRIKKFREITFTDRFYLVCSFLLAIITIFLLLLIWFKR